MRSLVALLKRTELVEVTEVVTDYRDEKDDKILELAVSGRADYIVSGDGDLLVLNPYRGVSIMRAQDFLGVEARPEI